MGLSNMRALHKSHAHTDTWNNAPLKHKYNTPKIKNYTQHLGVKKAAMGEKWVCEGFELLSQTTVEI